MTDLETPFDTLRELLRQQALAVLATTMDDRPYASLVGFAATDDCRCLVFVTGRATTKYRNLSVLPRVALLIDSRNHSVEDFTAAAAVTAVGPVSETTGEERDTLAALFVARHPHLRDFAYAPSTALCCVCVEQYYLVTRFQHVVEMDVTQWSSSNP